MIFLFLGLRYNLTSFRDLGGGTVDRSNGTNRNKRALI